MTTPTPVDVFNAADILKYSGGDAAAFDTFMGTFQGYHTLGGDGAAWTETAAWFGALADDIKLKVLNSCIIFMEKPTQFLVTGKTKAMMTAGTMAKPVVDVSVALYLPKISDADIAAMDVMDKAKMDKNRLTWPDEFKKINTSRIRRVALLGLQLCTRKTDLMDKWYVLYQGRPAVAVVPVKVTGPTRTIKEGDLSSFKNAKGIWSSATVIGHFALP